MFLNFYPRSDFVNKMKKLACYMKARAAFEGVEWQLTAAFLQQHFDQGIRTFFGVGIDEKGSLLSDVQQPDFLKKYHRRVAGELVRGS
jgi:hypothetical protein